MAVAVPAAAAGAAGGAGAAGAGGAAGGAGAAAGGKGGAAAKAGAGDKGKALDRLGRRGGGNEQEEREAKKRRTIALLLAPAAIALTVLLVFCVVLVSVFGARASQANGLGNAYPSGSGVPAVYWPMYVAAAGHYRVSPYLLASIHFQESRFSTAASSRSGFNSNGCCAGPMQFNVKAGVWAEHSRAFRPIAAARPRPPDHYPSSRFRLASCRAVPADDGCVYDDFDAIAAAARKLRRDGADTSLYSGGTHDAVCGYIGACSEVDRCTGSENAYCQVIPRARRWEQLGRAAEARAIAAIGPIAGGPLRETIVAVAQRELRKGVHEGVGNCNPYGPCAEWCAMFSTWVWERAGIGIRAAVSREGLSPYYVPHLASYAKAHGLWRTSPSPGDMIVWGAHVGLVVEMLGGGRIREIGGNQSDAVTELVGTPAGLGQGTPLGYISPPEGRAA